jgi:hypothetical protein
LFWIRACAIAIWGLVFQNYFEETEDKENTTQLVYVVGGNIDAEVTDSVDVSGSVDVDNTVSVEVENTMHTW